MINWGMGKLSAFTFVVGVVVTLLNIGIERLDPLGFGRAEEKAKEALYIKGFSDGMEFRTLVMNYQFGIIDGAQFTHGAMGMMNEYNIDAIPYIVNDNLSSGQLYKELFIEFKSEDKDANVP